MINLTDKQILIQCWKPFEAKLDKTMSACQLPQAGKELSFSLPIADFEAHPDNYKVLDQVVAIKNHPSLEIIEVKVWLKNGFDIKRWLVGKDLKLVILDKKTN